MMENVYIPLKLSHIVWVSISIILFNWRFWLRICYPNESLPKLLRILPHINDTLLLLTGFAIAGIGHWSPIASKWLGVKLILILFYIGLGFVCLKKPPRSMISNLAYVVCMIIIMMIVCLAWFKPI